MTRSLFSRAIAFAATACLAVGHAVHMGYAIARSMLGAYVPFMRQPDPGRIDEGIEPPKTLVSARAFRERQAQRKRPTVTARWRMCPSAC